VQASPRPVFLAGGLNAENVCEAIKVVRPFGLDLSTSVRTNGQLDPDKLAAFFASVRATDDLLSVR
jgi:phosphoribosylanthranilate isomerase